MNPSVGFGFLICLLLWGMWFYQIKTGNLLGRNWKVWTTEKEKPVLYWAIVGIQGFGFLVGTILLIRDALR